MLKEPSSALLQNASKDPELEERIKFTDSLQSRFYLMNSMINRKFHNNLRDKSEYFRSSDQSIENSFISNNFSKFSNSNQNEDYPSGCLRLSKSKSQFEEPLHFASAQLCQ